MKEIINNLYNKINNYLIENIDNKFNNNYVDFLKDINEDLTNINEKTDSSFSEYERVIHFRTLTLHEDYHSLYKTKVFYNYTNINEYYSNEVKENICNIMNLLYMLNEKITEEASLTEENMPHLEQSIIFYQNFSILLQTNYVSLYNRENKVLSNYINRKYNNLKCIKEVDYNDVDSVVLNNLNHILFSKDLYNKIDILPEKYKLDLFTNSFNYYFANQDFNNTYKKYFEKQYEDFINSFNENYYSYLRDKHRNLNNITSMNSSESTSENEEISYYDVDEYINEDNNLNNVMSIMTKDSIYNEKYKVNKLKSLESVLENKYKKSESVISNNKIFEDGYFTFLKNIENQDSSLCQRAINNISNFNFIDYNHIGLMFLSYMNNDVYTHIQKHMSYHSNIVSTINTYNSNNNKITNIFKELEEVCENDSTKYNIYLKNLFHVLNSEAIYTDLILKEEIRKDLVEVFMQSKIKSNNKIKYEKENLMSLIDYVDGVKYNNKPININSLFKIVNNNIDDILNSAINKKNVVHLYQYFLLHDEFYHSSKKLLQDYGLIKNYKSAINIKNPFSSVGNIFSNFIKSLLRNQSNHLLENKKEALYIEDKTNDIENGKNNLNVEKEIIKKITQMNSSELISLFNIIIKNKNIIESNVEYISHLSEKDKNKINNIFDTLNNLLNLQQKYYLISNDEEKEELTKEFFEELNNINDYLEEKITYIKKEIKLKINEEIVKLDVKKNKL